MKNILIFLYNTFLFIFYLPVHFILAVGIVINNWKAIKKMALTGNSLDIADMVKEKYNKLFLFNFITSVIFWFLLIYNIFN